MSRRFNWLLGVLLLCIGAGCVKTPVYAETPQPARLLISKGVNGVNMQWKGKEGVDYALYYRETVGVDQGWKIVPGFQQVTGTGGMIEYRDTSPTAKTRRYRVHTVSLSPERVIKGK